MSYRPSLAFFHGFMGTPGESSFLERATKTYDIISFDLSWVTETEDLNLIADELRELNPEAVYGYSMGGRILLHILGRYKAYHFSRLSRIFLESSALMNLPDKNAHLAREKWDQEKAALLLRDFSQFIDQWYDMNLWGGLDPHMANKWRRENSERFSSEGAREQLARQICQLSPAKLILPELQDLLKNYPNALFTSFHGTRDLKYSAQAKAAEELNLKYLKSVSIEGVGHAIHRQSQDFSLTLRKYL